MEVKLADVARAEEQHADVAKHLERALSIYEGLGKRERTSAVERRIARVHANLGRALADLDQLGASRDHWRKALELYERLDDMSMKVFVHEALVQVNERLGDTKDAGVHRHALKELIHAAMNLLHFWK